MSIKWQFAASSSKVGRDPGGHIASKEHNVWRQSPPWSMNLSNPSLLPLPGQFGCAHWNDICLQTYQKSSTLSSCDREKVPFSMLAWMLHLSVHLSRLMALRMNAKIKLFQYCCVSQFSNFSTILSWGRVLGECPHSNKSQTGVHRALHIPPLFTATFSVKEKKQSDCL